MLIVGESGTVLWPGFDGSWCGNEIDNRWAVLRALKYLLQFITLELVFYHHFVNELGEAG
ncbi:protein of unknown function [Candidatus Nitrotoga arctica]|uniref:Uncharacterized protein n=1 Tax=Candidatus Nitrotoga arctica TaxID=453162 RepID=A0ABN8AL04_9PROT|nr:protein of unknown function [Candidatus Nitrotoga arctica]